MEFRPFIPEPNENDDNLVERVEARFDREADVDGAIENHTFHGFSAKAFQGFDAVEPILDRMIDQAVEEGFTEGLIFLGAVRTLLMGMVVDLHMADHMIMRLKGTPKVDPGFSVN